MQEEDCGVLPPKKVLIFLGGVVLTLIKRGATEHFSHPQIPVRGARLRDVQNVRISGARSNISASRRAKTDYFQKFAKFSTFSSK